MIEVLCPFLLLHFSKLKNDRRDIVA